MEHLKKVIHGDLKFENILKIDIDCSFDKELSIEKVHDLTSEIEHVIRLEIKNSVITIHPEPNYLRPDIHNFLMAQQKDQQAQFPCK